MADMAAHRILVVDDDALILDAISRMLMHIGYEVLTAAGPRQALEIVRNSTPIHLVLADFLLPEMEGAQLIREVVRFSPRTVSVLMTGYVHNVADVPDDVLLLRKPFTREKLITAVQTALARSV